MIYFRCPKCDTAMQSPDSMADTSVPCPSCRSPVDVPAPDTPDSPGDSLVAPLSCIFYLLGVVILGVSVSGLLSALGHGASWGPVAIHGLIFLSVSILLVSVGAMQWLQKRKLSALGMGGLVFGLIALAIFIVPSGGTFFLCASPFCFLGLLFGMLGLVHALLRKESGIGVPIAAIVLSGVFLAGFLVYVRSYGDQEIEEMKARATQPAATSPSDRSDRRSP